MSCELNIHEFEKINFHLNSFLAESACRMHTYCLRAASEKGAGGRTIGTKCIYVCVYM
jgi:hypothetical protein